MRFEGLFARNIFSIVLISGLLFTGHLVGCASAGGPAGGPQMRRGGMQPIDPEEIVEQIMPRLTEELELTPEQEEAVRAILVSHHQAMSELMGHSGRPSGPPPGGGRGGGGRPGGMDSQASEDIERIEERTENALAGILTPEQMEKYHDVMEEIRRERMERMRPPR